MKREASRKLFWTTYWCSLAVSLTWPIAVIATHGDDGRRWAVNHLALTIFPCVFASNAFAIALVSIWRAANLQARKYIVVSATLIGAIMTGLTFLEWRSKDVEPYMYSRDVVAAKQLFGLEKEVRHLWTDMVLAREHLDLSGVPSFSDDTTNHQRILDTILSLNQKSPPDSALQRFVDAYRAWLAPRQAYLMEAKGRCPAIPESQRLPNAREQERGCWDPSALGWIAYVNLLASALFATLLVSALVLPILSVVLKWGAFTVRTLAAIWVLLMSYLPLKAYSDYYDHYFLYLAPSSVGTAAESNPTLAYFACLIASVGALYWVTKALPPKADGQSRAVSAASDKSAVTIGKVLVVVAPLLVFTAPVILRGAGVWTTWPTAVERTINVRHSYLVLWLIGIFLSIGLANVFVNGIVGETQDDAGDEVNKA